MGRRLGWALGSGYAGLKSHRVKRLLIRDKHMHYASIVLRTIGLSKQ